MSEGSLNYLYLNLNLGSYCFLNLNLEPFVQISVFDW